MAKMSVFSRVKTLRKTSSFVVKDKDGKAKNKKGETREDDSQQVRFVTIELPVKAPSTFSVLVDKREMMFTAPEGKEVGQMHEYAFTYADGPVAHPHTEASEKSQAAPAAAPGSPTPAPPTPAADAPPTPADDAPLAKELVDTAVSNAIAESKTPEKPGSPLRKAPSSTPSLKAWQSEEPQATTFNGLALLLAVLMLAVGVAMLLDASGALYDCPGWAPSCIAEKVTSAFSPPPPPPIVRKKFLKIF